MPRATPQLRFDVCFEAASAVPLEQLEAARLNLLAQAGDATVAAAPAGEGPAAFLWQPQRIIADYRAHRGESVLGKTLTSAGQLAAAVDRVVIVGSGPAVQLAQAICQACCHPFHNELGRGERGGQPRLYVAGPALDNDALQGLLDLLEPVPRLPGPEGEWAVVWLPTTSRAATLTLEVLRDRLPAHAGAISAGERLLTVDPPFGIAESWAAFTTWGLLPAALMGLDVRRLLEGATVANAHFAAAPAAENLVLQFVAFCRRQRAVATTGGCQLVANSPSLAALVRWHEQLCGSINSSPAAPIVQLQAERSRRDRLRLPDSTLKTDNGVAPAAATVCQQAAQLEAQQAAALQSAGRAVATLQLPQLSEQPIGELLQLLMLSAALETELAMAPAPGGLQGRPAAL